MAFISLGTGRRGPWPHAGPLKSLVSTAAACHGLVPCPPGCSSAFSVWTWSPLLTRALSLVVLPGWCNLNLTSCDIRDGPQRSDWDTHLALARVVCGAALTTATLLTTPIACGWLHWADSTSQDTETKGGSRKLNPSHTLKKENLGPNPSGYFPASLSETSSSFSSRTEESRLLFCSYIISYFWFQQRFNNSQSLLLIYKREFIGWLI